MAPLNISYEPAFELLARLLFDEDPDLVLMEYTYAIALEPESFPQIPGSAERWAHFEFSTGGTLVLTFRVERDREVVAFTAIAIAIAAAA
jgi:hypothetical protein